MNEKRCTRTDTMNSHLKYYVFMVWCKCLLICFSVSFFLFIAKIEKTLISFSNIVCPKIFSFFLCCVSIVWISIGPFPFFHSTHSFAVNVSNFLISIEYNGPFDKRWLPLNWRILNQNGEYNKKEDEEEEEVDPFICMHVLDA